MKYELINAEEIQEENPDTFELPSEDVLNNIQKRDSVQMIFEPGERMWVTVIGIHEEGTYTGLLDSYPVMADIEYGNVITFERKHIIDVYKM